MHFILPSRPLKQPGCRCFNHEKQLHVFKNLLWIHYICPCNFFKPLFLSAGVYLKDPIDPLKCIVAKVQQLAGIKSYKMDFFKL